MGRFCCAKMCVHQLLARRVECMCCRTFFQFFFKRSKKVEKDMGTSGRALRKFYPVFRLPVEVTWGCDLFLFWLVFDLCHKYVWTPSSTSSPVPRTSCSVKQPLVASSRLSDYCGSVDFAGSGGGDEGSTPSPRCEPVKWERQWRWKHRVNFGLSIFSVVTLFEYTLNLRPLYRRVAQWWRRIKFLFVDAVLQAALDRQRS